MTNQDREMPKADREMPKAAGVTIVSGGVLVISGALILLGSAIKARAEYGMDGEIPDSVLSNLDTVVGKLTISGLIILCVGTAIMTAGLIYAHAKGPNSSTADSTQEEQVNKPIEAGDLSLTSK